MIRLASRAKHAAALLKVPLDIAKEYALVAGSGEAAVSCGDGAVGPDSQRSISKACGRNKMPQNPLAAQQWFARWRPNAGTMKLDARAKHFPRLVN